VEGQEEAQGDAGRGGALLPSGNRSALPVARMSSRTRGSWRLRAAVLVGMPGPSPAGLAQTRTGDGGSSWRSGILQ